MYGSLPPSSRQLVADPTAALGMAGPDDFCLLPGRLETQRLDLEAVAGQCQAACLDGRY